jgi:hypothetical protein
VGHAGRADRPEDPQAAPGLVLPGPPGAPSHRRARPGGGDPGGVRARRLDAGGRRARAGHGPLRGLEERGLAPLCRDRRAGQRLPGPADRGRLAVPVDRCHLRAGPRERADREHRGDHRHRREHRWSARGAGHGDRPVRGRALLDGLPALARRPRFAGREVGGGRRSQGPARRGHEGAARHPPASAAGCIG